MDRGRLFGAIGAAVTPLGAQGEALDEEGIHQVVKLYGNAGLDGVLALGSTGEGILLSVAERRRVAEAFLEAADGDLPVAVHCGAQTTFATVQLAQHAAESGASAVVVIGPPYFALDEAELLNHLHSAALACAPTPFYLYEFPARCGYSVPVAVIRRLRELVGNLRGIKVSDPRLDHVERYLALEGLDVFVGAEKLISPALGLGAAGAVSGLASAFPELVARAVSDRRSESTGDIAELRTALQQFPFQAALKHALVRRGVRVSTDVRAPLRALSHDESRELDRVLANSSLVGPFLESVSP